ncbi:ComEA family DNA-binding protein [Enterococcus larvae]|uniref:ComEA family DNA-binding protein n=1 Tax=Enterococcus larvae TaxID=2794352 RepID=UPI003F34B2AB
MKAKNVYSSLIAVGVLFSMAIGLDNEQAEARTFIEGSAETSFYFNPVIDEDGTLSILQTTDAYSGETWSFGTANLSSEAVNGESTGMSLVGGGLPYFDVFNRENGLITISAEDYSEQLSWTDMTGYFVLDPANTKQVAVGYTRTENRMHQEEDPEFSYEQFKTGTLYTNQVTTAAQAISQLRSDLAEQEIYHVYPILRFEAAKTKGDVSSQFSVGSNVGSAPYYYYGTVREHGYETSQIFTYQGSAYETFYLPLSDGFAGHISLFVDVDAKTIGQQTEYSFRNFQVVLERYVPITMASYEELQLLDGIGVTLAQRIIEYRETVGFNSLDDLLNVRGIGTATVAKIKAQGLARVYDYFN